PPGVRSPVEPPTASRPSPSIPGETHGPPAPSSSPRTPNPTETASSGKAGRGKTPKTGGADSGSKPRSPRGKARKRDRGAGSPTAPMSGSATGAGRGGAELREYRITLSPGPDILRRGINPVGVFDELREIGQTTVTTDWQQVPALEEIDPERCYLNWSIH